MTLTREDLRQAVHAGVALLVIALPWLTRNEALIAAGCAVALNWVVLPVTGLDRRYLRREGAPFLDGVRWYPLAVLLAILLFPLPCAAAAWAVLGFGDAASNVIGRRLGHPPLLGRADRSLAGTTAFVVFALPAAAAAYAWTATTHGAELPLPTLLAAATAAALAGAIAELIPLPKPLDDNLPITLLAAAACWGVTLLA